MSNKPRNKKYNPRKIIPIAADASLRKNKLAVWFTINQKTAKIVSFKTNNIFDPDRITAELISQLPHYWSYTLIIFCRDQTGGEYIITGEPTLPDEDGIALSKRRLNQADLAESLSKVHKEFLKDNSNPLHVVNTGWIAVPYVYDVSEKVICNIADKHKVWNFMSKWESDKKDEINKLDETTKLIKSLKSRPVTLIGGT